MITLLASMTLNEPFFLAIFQAFIYCTVFVALVNTFFALFRVPGLVGRFFAQQHGAAREQRELAARSEHRRRQLWLEQKRDALESRARSLRAAMEVEGIPWEPIQTPRVVTSVAPAVGGNA